MYKVIIFANEAGYSCLSAFLENSTRPDISSITKDAYFGLACALDAVMVLIVIARLKQKHQILINLIMYFFKAKLYFGKNLMYITIIFFLILLHKLII